MGGLKQSAALLPPIRVDVVEAGTRTRTSSLPCVIDQNLKFSTESLESYFFAQWNTVVYDGLLVAAAVEYCDRTQRRPALGWGREIELRVPVHDPDHWRQKNVTETLHQTLDFLTGDRWQISFYPRKQPLSPPRQGQFRLSGNASAVIPFSDGLDSRAVAGLMTRSLGDKLIRIRLGHTLSRPGQPFTAVPYKVLSVQRDFVESSARSRGFKFALIAGVAAYFANAGQIIVPESGQGALGPALIPVGQAYEDYRSHPLFTNRMEQFLAALLGLRVSFQFPQLWQTKGETLSRFVNECDDGSSWADTWSCWQQSRQVSVENKKRQCGICAACILRRLSIHAAGLAEPKTTYVWEDLGARTFAEGAAAAFDRKKITRALREYAIAGTLHFDHLAGLVHSPANAEVLSLHALQLSQACKLQPTETRTLLHRLLTQHETEWKDFMHSLGPNSFVANWAIHTQ
jgi:7-cyano-7-deazaguanine synthase in queuosine biosynthesis